MKPRPDLTDHGRRRALGALALLPWGVPMVRAAAPADVLTRRIPSSGETMPVIGLGSWITFNVGADRTARDTCVEVVRAFFAEGGRMIDSSPMYGSSQPVIGHALAALNQPKALFSAEKVWIGDVARGEAQMEMSRAHWGVPRFDLMQVHNLVAWKEHLPRLFELKAAGRLRYVGITTSEGRRHAEIEAVMRAQPIDFVQISCNPLDREVESRILPLAADRGIAVIANRPFREGALTKALERHAVPPWAAEIGCTHWSQLALKWIVSHQAVTCVIPATSRVDHLRQNMAAMRGVMPDAALRERIARAMAERV